MLFHSPGLVLSSGVRRNKDTDKAGQVVHPVQSLPSSMVLSQCQKSAVRTHGQAYLLGADARLYISAHPKLLAVLKCDHSL